MPKLAFHVSIKKETLNYAIMRIEFAKWIVILAIYMMRLQYSVSILLRHFQK